MTADLLSYWLDQWYGASILASADPATVEKSFRKALADEDLKRIARERLTVLTSVKGKELCKRDFISKVHRDILEKVLNG